MEAMAQVLRDLPTAKHPDLLVGSEHFDDAGVFRISESLAIVQTLDFFPPLIDDPYAFGRIAAANSLSDIYAMGAKPICALNVVGFPDNDLPIEILGEILRGGAERVKAAGAVVAGGHSVRDSEIKFGLSVTGVVDPNRIVTNAGAKVGDRLVLTKPIGSGVLTTAAKLGKMPEAELDEVIHVMTSLNKPGAEAAVKVGVHACTDITGFGLIGHAFEIADGSDVTIHLDAAHVPLMKRTLELAKKGMLTRAWKTTRSHVGARLHIDPAVDEVLANILLDAQTSGGLLLSVAADRCEALLSELESAGAICNAVVGEVREASDVRVRLNV